nr:alpha-(1,3)-fucosyltransferase C-like isoform X1 [Procambarus clarkii]
MKRNLACLGVVTVTGVAIYMVTTLLHPHTTKPMYRYRYTALLTSHGISPATIPNNAKYSEPKYVDFPYEDFRISNNVSSVSEDLQAINQPKNRDVLDPYNPQLKKILFWNSVFGDKSFYFGFGREPFLRAGCRVNTCMTTADRSMFPHQEIDAIVWHFRSQDKSLPKQRSPHTRYVFWLLESPCLMFGSAEPFNQVFNWTFTYRLDSDFPRPYGSVYTRRKPELASGRNYAAGKTKMAAWLVSNCHALSGREELVQTLRKWLAIDQYGKCGRLRCKSRDVQQCYAQLAKRYKFYFSFENSLCRDYVTEKLFNVLRLDMVPVVYGLANYSQHAPPHSYIDALSFPTAKALADYLIYLDHNDTAYNEYFRWKRYYSVRIDWLSKAKPYCDLCERLHTDSTTKVYNLEQWFVEDSQCLTREDPLINAFINGR